MCRSDYIFLTLIPLFGLLAQVDLTHADCPGLGPIGEDPNVSWVQLPDSVTTCPAGDSVIAGHPSRVRAKIFYGDECHGAKQGVPPDSMWIHASVASGNLIVNDQPGNIYADDSTDANGHARFTIPSISGCGRLRLALFVTGVAYDTLVINVRSVDEDASGRVEVTPDYYSPCDVNYSGGNGNSTDGAFASLHVPHSHRYALFGTPLRRTNLLFHEYGSGRIDWQPSDSLIAYSYRPGGLNSPCQVAWIPSDPRNGSTPYVFTDAPNDSDDYDPAWSPRGFEIAFDRSDAIIYRKGIAGLAPDTDEHMVASAGANAYISHIGMSPNGRAIAYSRLDIQGAVFANIYVVSITGGAPKQLTSGSQYYDDYPSWSPDGRWVYFDRRVGGHAQYGVYKVPSDSGAVSSVYVDGDTTVSTQAASAAPDGRITVMAKDKGAGKVASTTDDNPVVARAVGNYAAYAALSTNMYPRYSNDGTRVAFVADVPGGSAGNEQLWATRRNMNLPPAMTAIHDTVITEGDSLTITAQATDPENDAMVYNAYFLPPGASFDSTTHRLAWRSGAGTAGNSYWVKFRVIDWAGVSAPDAGSGGTASRVVKISVIAPGRPMAAPAGTVREGQYLANPSRVGFSVRTPYVAGTVAKLEVYDIRGRRVATIDGPAGQELVWGSNGGAGTVTRAGIYFYRVKAGSYEEQGKWVLLK